MNETSLFKRWRLIVFDFDGTIVDSQHNIVRIMQQAFTRGELEPPTPDAVRRGVGLSLGTAVERLLPEDQKHRAPEVSSHYSEAAIAHRSSESFHEPLYPGARETIIALDQPEMRLGIATGKHMRGLRFSLEHHGLGQHFVTLQTADKGPGKPDPYMLTEAMAEAGCKPDETVMIGDTTFDMIMARHAGVTGIGVNWGYHGAEELRDVGALTVIDTFDALIPALKRAEGA